MRLSVIRKNGFTRGEIIASAKYKNSEKFRGVEGVYMLVKNGEVVYVGYSSNLHSRINSHVNYSDIDFASVIVLYETEPNIKARNLEDIIINIFLPKYNKQIPKLPIINDTVDLSNYEGFINGGLTEITRMCRKNKPLLKALMEL